MVWDGFDVVVIVVFLILINCSNNNSDSSINIRGKKGEGGRYYGGVGGRGINTYIYIGKN